MLRHVAFLLALGLSAAAAGAALPAPIVLEAPRDGEVLRAGEEASLAWRGGSAWAREAGIVEWEAFLSVDGGASYPLRITPHLDVDVQRLRFLVPVVPTDDARLLLRFGDEQREMIFELPVKFRISGGPWSAFPGIASFAWTPGEAARPGGPGVVAWIEGNRRGVGQRWVVAIPSGLQPAAVWEGFDPAEAWAESDTSVPGLAPPRAVAHESLTPQQPSVRASTISPAALDVLTLGKRRNE
ncbi:MAG TPA: hypothetical protein VN783_10340 [Thermoanaerobaculia bacterium]|nr:hypothetical protein [Thermoanaerobaculia bacterium]